jgi:hypothetical protein
MQYMSEVVKIQEALQMFKKEVKRTVEKEVKE